MTTVRYCKPSQVVRAADHGIWHGWHAKTCPETGMSATQHRQCQDSRAEWEGSKYELAGLLGRCRSDLARLAPADNDAAAAARPV